MINSIQGVCYASLISLTLASHFVLLPINLHLIIAASSIIYIGAHLSLKLKHRRAASGERNEEVMTAKDAYMFPVFGSCALFGLYTLFKLFDKDMVNLILTLYFAAMGTFSLCSTFAPVVEALMKPESNKTWQWNYQAPYFGLWELEVSVAELITVLPSAVFAYFWFQTRHFILNNIFGIAFSIKGIESLSLGSYKIGAILLVGLFFYDIFWVFGTDVMVTVAKSFDAPIKLLFPREFPTATEKGKFSMLGLGDIVIPGIFIALLLRYDAHRANVTTADQVFAKPFFHTNLVSYVLGLVATVVVMYAFNAAQPALLYLVPACLGASLVTAGYLKEFTQLLAYSEEEEEEDSKEDTKKDK